VRPRGSALLALGLAAGAALALAQNPPAQDKDKDKAKAAGRKPAPSFTDEDLKKYRQAPPPESTPTTTGATGATGSAPSARERESEPNRTEPSRPESDSRSAVEREGGPTPSDGKSPEESSWRARAAQARRPLNDARARVTAVEAQLADLRDLVNPMSTRYVMGGNSNAGPGAVLEAQDRITKAEAELESAKNEVAEAEKGFNRFVEEARSAGANPNWLNP
jgi:hypothetical protein